MVRRLSAAAALSRPGRRYLAVPLAGVFPEVCSDAFFAGVPPRFAAGTALSAVRAGAAFLAAVLLAAGGTASPIAVRSTTESSPPKSLRT